MSSKNENEIRFRTSEEFFARINADCAEKRIPRTEYMNSLVGKYYAEQNNNLSLFLSQFQRIEKSIEKVELRIDALTRMFIYFVQTFFFAHSASSENYIESVAYVEATQQSKAWFERIWQSQSKTNSNFVNEVLNLLVFEEMSNDQNESTK